MIGRFRFIWMWLAGVVLVGAAAGYWWLGGRTVVPAPGSAEYDETTRHFYRGLAALQVGLLDSARDEFAAVTQTAPAEPAGWANLGLAHLRLGEFEPAAAAVARAAELDPDSAAIAFLRGRLEGARGRREEGVTELRRAVRLAPTSLLARTALIQEIENAGGPDADAEAAALLEELTGLQPSNMAVLVDRARLAAKRGDQSRLADSLTHLDAFVLGWPPEVVEEFRSVRAASSTGNFADAARSLAFLRNVLSRVPAYRDSRLLVTPSSEIIAEPLVRFQRMTVPASAPAAADEALAYAVSTPGPAPGVPAHAVVALVVGNDPRPAVFAADGRAIRRVDAAGPALTFPGGASATAPSPNGLAAVDWNHDFRQDLVAAGAGGVRLYEQTESGAFTDVTARAGDGDPSPSSASGVWPADIEMDGDLDLVVGVPGGSPVVLRNNGDGTWKSLTPFAGIRGLRAFVWGDLDVDGDPDAGLIDEQGVVSVFMNMQGGEFRPSAAPTTRGARVLGLALGDLDADGRFDLVTLDAAGRIDTAAWGEGAWQQRSVTVWAPTPTGLERGGARLVLADLDNNGALDVLAAADDATAVWLMNEQLSPQPLAAATVGSVSTVVDLDRNGVLDLAGVAGGVATLHTARASRNYHYHVIRPRAQSAAGDQRINSFGIGGEVEVRSGRLVQKQVIAGDTVHVGLGTRTSVDVTRIVWPNGVPQAEFDPAIDQPIVAAQRLKGSCPWIFADNGSGLTFVTDFLWRSPLGLKINASDTAGVTQTEDWVKIRGDQLVARDGAYDVRISAELWETHFVDHVSLMVVDHPVDTDVFVDERFVPVAAPALAVHTVGRPEPVAQAWDQAGREVTDVVARRDGRYLGTFERGRYQGVATDHFVEVDLGRPLQADGRAWLVAYGWIYPTDSSINVAIGQGQHVVPESLSLEAQDARGRWVTVARNLGFPAGKNKTVLLDLSAVARAGVPAARRLRLRTNLEIYWDFIATASDASSRPSRTVRVQPARADLVYRGFSKTVTERREEPETPVYAPLASLTPRWRDLTGYYTRFGDVRELLAGVDDRYVIMNAGDELRFSFPAPPPPPAGWTRDFVLAGDGWVKDGDFNTSYAKTVLPLPEHARSDYRAARAEPALDDDPVYRRHAADWQTFHTRYVDPRAYLAGLRLQDDLAGLR